MATMLDLSGMRFGRLLAIKSTGKVQGGGYLWECLCDCGNSTTVSTSHLRSGHTRSCGCLHAERASNMKRSHNMNRSPEHLAWKAIHTRCKNENYTEYAIYGGRGIRICSGWDLSFVSFFQDMGKKPTSMHSVDRIDTNGHYSCGHCDECIANGWKMNCRWATPLEQGRNTRRNRMLTCNGETRCLSEWCQMFDLPIETVRSRLERGLSVEESLKVKGDML